MKSTRTSQGLALFVALVFGSVVLTSCGASAPTALARGRQGVASQIPWSLVGSQWTTAMWSPVSDQTSSAALNKKVSLYLVDPKGGRYLVGRYGPESSLRAWSYSLRRVELSTWHNGQETYETVALATGAVLAKWKVSPSLFDDVSFANAAGTRLLIDASTSSTGDSSQLQERSLTGRVVIKYPADTSPPIGEIAVDEPSGDIAMMQSPTRVGAENILNHVIFFSPRGTTLRNVSLTNYRYCGIDRWWSRQSVLMDCTPGTSEKFVLLLVNEHAVTHVLTGIPSGYGFEGDVDGWQLTSGLFIQEASFCGEFVAKSTGWHTRATVKIPHSSGSDVAILGATHSDLLVHSQNECEPGQSVLWFNPAHAQSTVVLGPPLTKGSVTSALPDPRNYS